MLTLADLLMMTQFCHHYWDDLIEKHQWWA
jgi:hypothetical protein